MFFSSEGILHNLATQNLFNELINVNIYKPLSANFHSKIVLNVVECNDNIASIRYVAC